MRALRGQKILEKMKMKKILGDYIIALIKIMPIAYKVVIMVNASYCEVPKI